MHQESVKMVQTLVSGMELALEQRTSESMLDLGNANLVV
jgi:hypothetical protein